MKKKLYFLQVNYAYGNAAHLPYTAAQLCAYAFADRDVEENFSLERIFFLREPVDRLLEKIEKSKENDLSKLIFAFGIRHIGAKSAKLISENFGNIDNVLNATKEDFESIEGFGSILAESAAEFFSLEDTKEMIEKLEN